MENIDRQFTPIVVKEMKVVMNTFEGYNVENECLGQGGWGKVFAATRKCDQKKFAMKFFGYTNSNPVVEAINSEIVLMMALTGVEGLVFLKNGNYMMLTYFTLQGLCHWSQSFMTHQKA